MVSGLAIFLIIIALLVGIVIGYFGARYYMQRYIRENPPITEEMMRTMMMQMGQKPSERKLHQMMQTMRTQAKRAK
ncbi:YneF family protein [Limosilactobacillus sp.]|uniref:YneF family protein n=1 Tax=Limosilactobacillus sp. TaxID=2773925 RepID=UPI00345E274C